MLAKMLAICTKHEDLGSVIAAAFLVLLPEALRYVGMPNAIAANMRQIIYGGILIFMMFWYNRGFTAETRA